MSDNNNMRSSDVARRYTFTVTPSKDSADDFIATCAEFPSMSSVQGSPVWALDDLIDVIHEAIIDMVARGEAVPAGGGGR